MIIKVFNYIRVYNEDEGVVAQRVTVLNVF